MLADDTDGGGGGGGGGGDGGDNCDSGAVFFSPTIDIGGLMGNYVVFSVVPRYDNNLKPLTVLR